jgi:WD40 repeat protein
VTEILARSDDPTLAAIPDCPYKGLHAYTEADGEYFFGRDSDRDLVIANLIAGRLTVLYGPSGVGKSSLLQAGVMRHLRQMPESAFSYLAVRNAIIVYHSSWHNDSLTELGHELVGAVPDPDGIEDLVQAQRPLSVELLRELTDRLNSYVYLLLDQFEEHALYQPGSKGDKFLKELGQIITTPGLRASVLLGIREDALSKLDPLEAYVPGLYDNSLPLAHLNSAEAREAIEGPLTRYNELVPPTGQVDIESELIDELLPQLQTGKVSVGDLGQGGVRVSSEESPASSEESPASSEESIETPFLQLVMTRLWEEEAQQGSRVLRRATLEDLGGADRIVRTHLDAVMAELSEQEQDIAARMFRYLVTPSGAKYSYTTEDLAKQLEVTDLAPVKEVLEKLAASRELVLRAAPPPLDSPESPRYEIFHDVMVPAVLDWRYRYEAERQRIASEQALHEKSRRAEEEFRKERKRLRLYALLSAALALVLLLITAVGVLVVESRNARRASVLNEGRALLGQYETLLDSDPAASLRTALQAWRKLGTAEAEGAVRTAFEADTQRAVVQGDHGDFKTSEFSPDGLSLLTSGNDGTAKLLDALTGQLIRTFKPSGTEPPSPLLQASVSDDGKMVLTTGMDLTVHVYDFATGRDLGVLARHSRARWGTIGDRPVVLTYDGSAASLWDSQSLKNIKKFGQHTIEAALSPDGQHILTVNNSTVSPTITVWDVRSGQREQTLVPGSWVANAQFAAKGWNKVVFRANVTSSSWQVMLWDWRKGSNALQPTDGRSRRKDNAIAVSKDGQFFAAAVDKRVTMFNAEDGRLIGDIPNQPDWVNDIDLSADGNWLVTGGNDGKALVWNAHRSNNRPIAELLGHRRGISDVRFDPNSSWRLTTASSDGTARTWELAPHTDFMASSHWMLDTDISHDGLLLVTAEYIGNLRVYERASVASSQWSQAAHTSLPGGGLGIAKLTPDRRTVVSARLGADLAPYVWAWQSGSPPHRLPSSGGTLNTLAISGDGGSVAAGDSRNRVVVWNLSSGEITARLMLPTDHDQVTHVAYVPNSTLIAVASTDGAVRLFDPAKSEQPVHILGEIGGPEVKALDVSTDGAYLATASEDRNVRIWRTSDGTLQQTITGPPSNDADVALSPDGKLVALATADAAVYIWEWQENRKLAVLRRHVDAINSVQFSPDGRIITASDDSTVAIYPCTTCQQFDELLKAAEERDRKRR